jgi:outer membrane protein TolC
MKTHSIRILVPLVVLVVLSVRGAGAFALTLPQAVHLALLNNPDLRASRLSEQSQQTRSAQAIGSYLPTLAVGESFISTNNPLTSFGILLNEALVTSTAFSNLNTLNNPANTQTFGFQAAVSETIFSGGGRYHQLKAANRESEAQHELVRWKEKNLVAQTARAYLDVLLSSDRVSVLSDMVRTAREEEKIARDNVAAGKNVRAELLSASVHVKHLSVRLLEAQKDVTLARIRLSRLLGQRSDAGLLSRDPSLLPRAISAYRILEREGVDSLVGQALSDRPDYRALKKRIEERDEMAKGALAGFFPQVSAQGLYNEFNPTLAWGKQDYTVIGQVQWNLFNGLSDREKRQRSVLSLMEERYREEDRKNALIYDVRSAYAESETLSGALSVDRERLKEEAEERRIVHERFAVGLVRFADMLRSDVAYRRARLRLLTDRTRFVEAVLALKLAIGSLSEMDPVIRGQARNVPIGQ